MCKLYDFIVCFVFVVVVMFGSFTVITLLLFILYLIILCLSLPILLSHLHLIYVWGEYLQVVVFKELIKGGGVDY